MMNQPRGSREMSCGASTFNSPHSYRGITLTNVLWQPLLSSAADHAGGEIWNPIRSVTYVALAKSVHEALLHKAVQVQNGTDAQERHES